MKKYVDKHTVRSSTNWHNKQFANDDLRNEVKEKNRINKILREFSYTIDDKIWWNSLTDENKMSVHYDYNNFEEEDILTWYSGRSGYSGYYTSHFNKSIKESLSPEEHKRRIDVLKTRYKQVTRRRELVIDEILKSK